MEHQKAFTKLTKRIAIEKTILSYRLAARELGISVQDAKQLLAAYLESDPAKERGVTATYLLTGYLKQDGSAPQKNGHVGGGDAMDVDGVDATPSSQNGDGTGVAETDSEVIKTKTMMVVQQDELEAKTALFSPAPSSHIYALAPTRLTSLDLLSASALSLIRPEVREQKWKSAPEGTPAYGGIVHPDGERKVPQGKRKAPPMPPPAAPKAGPSGTSSSSKSVKKEELEPAKAKGKAVKGKEKETTAAKSKAKKEEPKIRPIGQLGGLFAKKFEDNSNTKGKKKAADSDDSAAEDDDEEEEEEEDVKPKKKSTVPAKRKSTSPAVSRKKPAPPPDKKPVAKKTPEIIMADDDDEFDDWQMDEEALMEAERAAEQSVKAAKGGAGNSASASATMNKAASTSSSAAGPKKGETKAERQKRELEEMMKSDDMDIDEKKPSRAPSRELSSSSVRPSDRGTNKSCHKVSRTPSSSSAAAGKSAADKKKAAAPAQKSLGAFFKKG